MKAIVCKEFGPPSSLVYEDVELPELKKSQIQIDVHSAGVNFPDTLIIQDKYQVKPPLPFSPGGEISGVISAVGESVNDCCLLYTSPSPRDRSLSRMPSSA